MIRDGPYGLYSATPPGKSTDRDRVIAPSGQNRSNGGHALHRALGRGADLAGVGQVAAVQERGFYWTRFAAEGSPNGPTAPRLAPLCAGHRLGACLQHPRKARHVVPRRDRRLGRPPGPPPSLSPPAVGGSAGGTGLRGSAASSLI